MTNHETASLKDVVNPDIIAWCEQSMATLAAKNIGAGDWRQASRDEKYDRLNHIVGRTPIEAVPEMPGNFSKLEYLNPSGSHYDRVTLDTLRSFEERGLIQPGDELRDISTGSGGTSDALFGKLLGYKVRIGFPQELPASRIYPMIFFGAELFNTGPGYIQGASDIQADEIRYFKESPDWVMRRDESRDAHGERVNRAFFFQNRNTGARICYINNSENSISVAAHKVLAHEMIMQFPEPPAALFIAEGNWTTISGIAPEVRKSWPETQIVSVAPAEFDEIDNFGLMVPGLTMPLRFRDPSLLDRQMYITNADREAMRTIINQHRPAARRLGNSSLLLCAASQQIDINGSKLKIEYDNEMKY